jgi:hypothetical protein
VLLPRGLFFVALTEQRGDLHAASPIVLRRAVGGRNG